MHSQRGCSHPFPPPDWGQQVDGASGPPSPIPQQIPGVALSRVMKSSITAIGKASSRLEIAEGIKGMASPGSRRGAIRAALPPPRERASNNSSAGARRGAGVRNTNGENASQLGPRLTSRFNMVNRWRRPIRVNPGYHKCTRASAIPLRADRKIRPTKMSPQRINSPLNSAHFRVHTFRFSSARNAPLRPCRQYR